jgi:hypothetical protein
MATTDRPTLRNSECIDKLLAASSARRAFQAEASRLAGIYLAVVGAEDGFPRPAPTPKF